MLRRTYEKTAALNQAYKKYVKINKDSRTSRAKMLT